MSSTIKDRIMDSLDSLDSDRLKKFKEKLIDMGKDGQFPRAEVEKYDTVDLATRLIAVYQEHGAVENTIKILRNIHENKIASDLENRMKVDDSSDEDEDDDEDEDEEDESSKEKDKLLKQLRRLAVELERCRPGEFESARTNAVDVTLDPRTAHPSLIVSRNGKQVRHGDIRQDLPDNPERFTSCVDVLGKDGITSGRHYWEVKVKNKSAWTLGVVRESIKRKGQITLSPEKGFWTVWLRKGKYEAITTPSFDLPLTMKPRKVGVYVDYEGGQVSFYNVEEESHIYTFTCNFREKIYPFFGPCTNDGGKNSAPLIITPVSPSE
ncbi:erythroid membrane-associated protein-like isoform X2 [Lepisosteus oculatus]|uniref:erythroid membrane-associated protein-like isoform X2 n=1 Tax=Lepisosteus oculatus TaxID=7918 RepID=UPI00371D5D82